VRLRELLSGVKVGEVMNAQCAEAPGGITLARLVQEYVLTSGQRCFFVYGGGGLQGMISLHQVKEIPKDRWDEVTVMRAMTPAHELLSVPPGQDVWTLLQKMDEKDVNQVPVIENGSLLGVVSRDRLLRYIRLRSELEV
jgi:CBS domain-containing protein